MDAGIDPKRITVVGECTACAREENGDLRYFSHRGENGVRDGCSTWWECQPKFVSSDVKFCGPKLHSVPIGCKIL